VITAERTMVESTACVEDVEMTWTQSDQEAVEATYGQELAGAAGSPEDGLEPAGGCGQSDSLEQQGFRRPAAAEVDGVLALRQPGSTLKPFLYAQAIAERRRTGSCE